MAGMMASGDKPPIVGTAVAAWRDAFAAIAAMPVISGTTFVLMLIVSGVSAALLPVREAAEAGAALQLASAITSIIQAFLLAPLAIAVHRYVLLGEISTGFAVEPSNPRYLRFVGFAVVLNVLMVVPGIIFAVLPADGPNMALGAVGFLLAFVLFIVIAIVTLRRVILFPAIAIDATGAGWANARNDTKGHTWRVFFIMVCVSIPVIAISAPLFWMLMKPPGVTLGSQIIFVVLSSCLQIPAIAAFAAAASHIFRALADRLARSGATP